MDADKVALIKTEVHLLPTSPPLQAVTTQHVSLLRMHQPDIRSKIYSCCATEDKIPESPEKDGIGLDDEAFVVTYDPLDVACFKPAGVLSYMNCDGLEEQMKKLVKLPALLVALDDCYMVDVDSADKLGKMMELFKEHKMVVVVSGVGGPGQEALEKMPWYQKLEADGLAAATRLEGHKLLVQLLSAKQVEVKAE